MPNEVKLEILTKFMFKKAGIKYTNKSEIETDIFQRHAKMSHLGFTEMQYQRKIMDVLYGDTRKYEIWQYAEAMLKLAPNEETLYKLVGLAWQESHFVNKRGKKREVSCFQFLPSTIAGRFNIKGADLEFKLHELENDPWIATALALEMMTEYKWHYPYWNSNPDYTYWVSGKTHSFKNYWNNAYKEWLKNV